MCKVLLMSVNHQSTEELPYSSWNVVGQNYIILRRIQPTGGITYKDRVEGDCFEGWLCSC